MDSIHINMTKNHRLSLHKGHCPDCKKRSWFTGFFQDWYGWDYVCMVCGRMWIDGEWMRLPFSRTARQDSIAAAKKRFRRGVQESSMEAGT